MGKGKRFMQYGLFFICLPAVLYSCGSGNNVASSFGKRKYTKGYYLNIVSPNNDVIFNCSNKNNGITKPPEFSQSDISVPVSSKHVMAPLSFSQVLASQPLEAKGIIAFKRNELNLAAIKGFIRPGVDSTSHDTTDEDKKDQKINRILGISGFAAAVAGVIFILTTNFIPAIILILIGLVISAIGIRRGSNSLFAFFGFIVSALGLIVLLDILIVTR